MIRSKYFKLKMVKNILFRNISYIELCMFRMEQENYILPKYKISLVVYFLKNTNIQSHKDV